MQRYLLLELHAHMRQRQRMAQWNQQRRVLGALDRRQPRHTQHVAFLRLPLIQQGKGLGLHGDMAGGRGAAAGFRLLAHIHHVGLAGGIEVRQGRHGIPFGKLG